MSASSSPIPTHDIHGFVRENMHDTEMAAQFSALARRNYCVIRRIEDFRQYVRFPVALSRTTYYALLLIECGTMTRSDGFRTYSLVPGTLYFDAPGGFFGIDDVSVDCIGHFALFDAEYILSALPEASALQQMPFFQIGQRPDVALPPDVTGLVTGYLRQAQTYLSRPPFADQQALVSTLLRLILLTARPFSTAQPLPPPTAATTLVQRFNALALEHFRTQRAVTDYADLLAVTPRYLGRCVKQVTGQTPAALLISLRLREAQVLLRGTTWRVAEIAYHLGFDDLSYFARLLRQHTGLSPTAYRQNS
jgi:AraC family transcriptional regulator, transcriptional activator of pobA